jgi:hypothetical protein
VRSKHRQTTLQRILQAYHSRQTHPLKTRIIASYWIFSSWNRLELGPGPSCFYLWCFLLVDRWWFLHELKGAARRILGACSTIHHDVALVCLCECYVDAQSWDIYVFLECRRIYDDAVLRMKNLPKAERRSAILVSSPLEYIAEHRYILKLPAPDTCVYKQAHILENQMTCVDGVVKLVFCKIVHALEAGYGKLHSLRPSLGHLLEIFLWIRCHCR